ncbi:MAG: hypothetical protein CL765_06665 [Chloroflexi bacterium]|nr:hypothetical protein [Chloroflexota bacterium]|tara:strand:+ start:868 stop:1395 length:528 start_codon:yes stop_codon:yes gene_type:complete
MESSTAIMNNKFIAVVLLIVLAGLAVTACGGDPGEGKPSQEGADKTGEFHGSPIASKIQELSVDLDKTDGTCKATPGDLISPVGVSVRLNVQIAGASEERDMKSTEAADDRNQVKYEISGMTIKSAGGALETGMASVALSLPSGSKKSYDFSIGAPGVFAILCDGIKVGTFTATE